MVFDSVVSSITTSVKLSSSISSSRFGKLLEFSLTEKVRTGSVGNVLVYWLTEKTIWESPNQWRKNCVNALYRMVAKLKSTTHYGLSMRINTSSKVKVTTQFFSSVFMKPLGSQVRRTWSSSSNWFGSCQISSWWKLVILLVWCPQKCVAPVETKNMGSPCS